MESFGLGGEWGGRAGASESCCYKIILQPLVLPTLSLPLLRAATKCSVRVRTPHASAWAGFPPARQVCAAGEGLHLLPWLFWGAWIHMEKHCRFPSFLSGETQRTWFFGEPEAERGRTEAYKYLGEWQGGKLFTSTQEQCWHKNIWTETSKNKLGLEMQRFPSSVGELSVCIKGAGIKA